MIVDMEESTRTLVRAFMYLGCLTIYMVIKFMGLVGSVQGHSQPPIYHFQVA